MMCSRCPISLPRNLPKTWKTSMPPPPEASSLRSGSYIHEASASLPESKWQNVRGRDTAAIRFYFLCSSRLRGFLLCGFGFILHINLGAQPTNTNALRPFQFITTNTPPLPPSRFNPDAGAPLASTNIARPEPAPQLNRVTNSLVPPTPPPLFNPDPGASLKRAEPKSPFFKQELPPPPGFQEP